ncbi:phytoene desaturase family protein [Marinimicrobium agarilyticum]|uniref:phytoene desaturase family protein n=1 Tax=Marinimicrobium agarilyticum TaxID=306546 RepID=UPI000484DFC8|nr:FAD-dependent oxidoreductase [Marinimicrobium agarilyticum]
MTINSAKRVVIVGAGLSGLVAALTLQTSGYHVTLLERRQQVGGLCGTFFREGYEFVIACNDFGIGLNRLLVELGVPFDFEHKKSSVFYQGEWFNAAPDWKMLKQLRREWISISSLLWGVLKQQLPNRKPISIETFVDRYARPGKVNDLAKIVAYFMGVGPYDLKTSFFGLESQYDYGYTKMSCPRGGPQALSNAIVSRFQEQGGTLCLGTSYVGHTSEGEHHMVSVLKDGSGWELETDYIINSSEQTALYPKNTKRGLPLSMLCMAVDAKLPYPENTHTLTYYEPEISRWFRNLDQGEAPEHFGFHVFKNELAGNPKGTYTLNAYFYLPRGVNSLDDNSRDYYRGYLLDKLEEMLPGLKQYLRYTELLTPDDFAGLHGLSSRVMPFITAGPKPSITTNDPTLFRAGHTVYPPGEHAGAAALSGQLVAKAIMTS